MRIQNLKLLFVKCLSITPAYNLIGRNTNFTFSSSSSLRTVIKIWHPLKTREIQQEHCNHGSSKIVYFYTGSLCCASFSSRIDCYKSVLTSRSSTIDFGTHFWITIRRILGCNKLLSDSSNPYSCPWINRSSFKAPCSLKASRFIIVQNNSLCSWSRKQQAFWPSCNRDHDRY